jgi:hypothetical protein
VAKKRRELRWYGDARPTGPDVVGWKDTESPLAAYFKRLWRRLTRR